MKAIKFLLFTVIILISVLPAKATHYMGGEITWECIPAGQPNAGKFVFVLKLYRECYTSGGGSAASFSSVETLNSTSPAGSISMNIVSGWPKDISPNCNLYAGAPGSYYAITCTGMPGGAANMGAVQEYYYRSAPIQLNGVPPISGWTFSHSSCCRNPCSNVPNAGSKSWYLRAKMYPYLNTNTYHCFDNSPTFAEVPRTVICTGYPFTYNHNAYDKELNTLVFEWGQPMESASNSLPFNLGYSYTSPLPGALQNPLNVPGTVNVTTGEISFTSYTAGAYVTSTKVTAFRCGVKVAEIWRDMQIVLLNCGVNTPPDVTPPFALGTSYQATTYANQPTPVTFAINGTDFEYLPSGFPQTMKLEATGMQFGAFIPPIPPNQATFSTTTGCLLPPCAKLTPAPGPGYPLLGIFGIQTEFFWQPKCQHLAADVGCGITSNVYNFVFKVLDDFCPAPAINISTVTITVLPPPALHSPLIQCANVLPNGDVELKWSPLSDSMNVFSHYNVLSSTNPNGPFLRIDSIVTMGQNSFIDTAASADTGAVYYMLQVVSGCPGYLSYSSPDTFATIFLDAINPGNGYANLNWTVANGINNPHNMGVYHVYREFPAGNVTLIGTTTDTFFVEPISVCGNDITYFVTLVDTLIRDSNNVVTVCTAKSNEDSEYFADIIPPNIPIIEYVTVDNSNDQMEIKWDQNQPADLGGYVLYILQNGSMTPFDTIYGTTSTYIDSINQGCVVGQYNTYGVASFDTCGMISVYGFKHNTMTLDAYKHICDDKISISWNPYNNMTGGLLSYDIYVSENGGPFVLLNSNPPTDTTFDHVGLTSMSSYTYEVRAMGANGVESVSCHRTEIAVKPNQPQFAYIRSASVITGNLFGNEVTLHTDTTAKVTKYRVERSEDNVTWGNLTTLNPDYFNPTRVLYDPQAMVMDKYYYYRFIVVDSCNDDAMTSTLARSIRLTVVVNDSMYNKLTWSKYIGFDGTPTSYEIYRAVDGIWEPNPLVTLPANQSTYNDDVSVVQFSGGSFEYFVKAVEGLGNQWNFVDEALSNSVVALQKPRLFVPSAFNPNSTNVANRVFYPVGIFTEAKDYLFIVYNRWGQKVHETTKVTEGWDGTVEGGIDAPEGVYTYYIRFTTSQGDLYENRGTTTLLR